MEGNGMAKYSKEAQEKIKKVIEEFEKGELKSGKSKKKVTSKDQAIAIGISEARKRGYKVPQQGGKTTKKSTSEE